MKTPSLISILGPTASGKTSLAVTVAKQISGEVIGLDSRQIYIDMEIGTAQPSKVEMDGIPHHLIGFRSPTQSVSAGEYAKMVTGIVDKIQGRGNNPIICGGAGLYYRALTEGIFSGSKSDLAVREDLNKEYDELGGEILLDRLKTVDPEYAGITHPNNRKRLVRALEIYLSTGKTPSEHFLDQKSSTGNTIRPFSVWLNVEMDYLESRIRQRTINMMNQGWVKEVKALKEKYGESNIPVLDSIGYRQIFKFLHDELNQKELIDEIVLRTRQFARRQVQWFRKEQFDFTVNINDNYSIMETSKSIVDAWE